MSNPLIRRIPYAVVVGLVFTAALRAQPSKEYIRLGGRVIAIESPAGSLPAFEIVPSASSVTVLAGNSVANQINLSLSNFSGAVAFTATTTAPGLTASNIVFSPNTMTSSGSTAITLTVPPSVPVSTYLVTVTASSVSPAVTRTATFSLVVNAGSPAAQSAIFGPAQYLLGTVPASIDSQTNWRLETRVHNYASSLAMGGSRLVQLGSLWISFYRTNSSSTYDFVVYAGNLAVTVSSAHSDIFLRFQRNGANSSLKVWSIASDGSLSVATSMIGFPAASSGVWNAATLSPQFGLGAIPDPEGITYGRLPLNGSIAFFRHFAANADDGAVPNLCDSTSPALIRYEFENNLTQTGTSSASLTPTGTIGYQASPASSCSIGGAPPAFTLVPGSQSPAPVAQGAAATFPVAINRQNFTGNVTFAGCTGANGVTCTASATAGNSSTVTVQTSANTPVGSHNLLLSATGAGGLTATANLSLSVSAPGPPPPSFTLQVSPNQVTFSPTGTQTLTATLYPGSGFTGNVSFACTPAPGVTLPSAISCVAPNPASDSQPQRSFTVSAASGAAQGTYNLVLTGTGPQAQTATANIQVTIAAGGIRAFIFPSFREISINPGAYYQFLSTVENSGNSQVNWMLTPVSGGLTTAYPPSGNGNSTAGPASYVFYRPPTSLPGAQQNVILTGTPAVGGIPGDANLLLRTDPYVPPVICLPGATAAPCVNETVLPTALSSSSFAYLTLESHYSGTFSVWSNGRLHRTLRASFALDPENPWGNGTNSCLIRVERSLGYGAPDGNTLILEGGTQTVSTNLWPGASGNLTNGVCTVWLQYTTVSTNFSAHPTKAWFTFMVRFNAASAPRYLFYQVDSFNSTTSGTVLMRATPFTVNP